MNLFCLDTSTEYAVCSVGRSNGEILSAKIAKHERQLSTRIYATIDQALFDSGLTLAEIDIFAVGIGPGSFTGVRVAVTTQRTFAQALNKQLVAVGTLQAMAFDAARKRDLHDSHINAILPSRRGEVYCAAFGPDLHPLHPPTTATYEQIQTIPTQLIAGPAALLDTIFPTRNQDWLISIEYPDPNALLNLAIKEVEKAAFQDPLSLDPLYTAPPAVSQHKLQG